MTNSNKLKHIMMIHHLIKVKMEVVGLMVNCALIVLKIIIMLLMG